MKNKKKELEQIGAAAITAQSNEADLAEERKRLYDAAIAARKKAEEPQFDEPDFGEPDFSDDYQFIDGIKVPKTQYSESELEQMGMDDLMGHAAFALIKGQYDVARRILHVDYAEKIRLDQMRLQAHASEKRDMVINMAGKYGFALA